MSPLVSCPFAAHCQKQGNKHEHRSTCQTSTLNQTAKKVRIYEYIWIVKAVWVIKYHMI